jgi:hypothetical protein
MVTGVTGVMVGRIKEQHAGHIILSDTTRLSLANGLTLEQFDSGELVTITYGRDSGGGMVVQSITRSAALRAYYAR